MIFRKRNSRKAADRIRAVKFNGFQKMPTGFGNKPVMPDWMPQIKLIVIDKEGTYEGDEIDPTPAGDFWRCGEFVRIGTADGHKDIHPGGYIVKFPDGQVFGMTAEELKSEYKAV